MSDRDPGEQARFDRDKDRDRRLTRTAGPRPARLAGRARRAGRAVRRASTPQTSSSMLEQVLGQAAENPELAAAMRSMGVDPSDPATKAAMRAQLGTFMAAQQSPTGARTSPPTSPASTSSPRRATTCTTPVPPGRLQDAVAVAVLWLDEVTALGAPLLARDRIQQGRVGRGDHAPLVRPRRARLRRGHERDVGRDPQAARRPRARGLRRRAATGAAGHAGRGLRPGSACSSSGPRCCRTSAARCSRPSSARPSAPSPPRSWARPRWASRSPSRASSPCCPATSTSSRPRSRSTCPGPPLPRGSRGGARPAVLRRCRGSVRS